MRKTATPCIPQFGIAPDKSIVGIATLVRPTVAPDDLAEIPSPDAERVVRQDPERGVPDFHPACGGHIHSAGVQGHSTCAPHEPRIHQPVHADSPYDDDEANEETAPLGGEQQCREGAYRQGDQGASTAREHDCIHGEDPGHDAGFTLPAHRLRRNCTPISGSMPPRYAGRKFASAKSGPPTDSRRPLENCEYGVW